MFYVRTKNTQKKKKNGKRGCIRYDLDVKFQVDEQELGHFVATVFMKFSFIF